MKINFFRRFEKQKIDNYFYIEVITDVRRKYLERRQKYLDDIDRLSRRGLPLRERDVRAIGINYIVIMNLDRTIKKIEKQIIANLTQFKSREVE